jgi:hypothetical protein
MMCVTISCNKDAAEKNTFIAYNLNGATCNGAFRIDDDGDVNTLDAVALLVPATNNQPEVIILTFTDYADERGVTFHLPAQETGNNPILLTFDSDFGMTITHSKDDWLLFSGVENTVSGVSIDIQKFKRGTSILGLGSVKELQVYFTGIMHYKNEMLEIEQHTVEGNFYYKEQL